MTEQQTAHLANHRRTRAELLLPPQQQPRTGPVPVAGDQEPELEQPEQPELVPAPAAPPAPVVVKPELKVVTIYLDDDDDDLLEATTHAARATPPKVAISRSAIIRHALKELYARKTPEQIVEDLRPRGGPYGVGIGRKRR